MCNFVAMSGSKVQSKVMPMLCRYTDNVNSSKLPKGGQGRYEYA